MTTPKPIPANEYMNILSRWPDQMLKEQLEFFEAADRKLTAEQVKAYSAGFKQAWGKCLNTLKFHKYLVQYHTVTNIYSGEKSEQLA